MNCKPGDLAVVIRDADAPENIGRIVKVLRAFEDGPGWYQSPVEDQRFAWEVEPVGKLFGWGAGGVLVEDDSITAAADDDLRPIRDPGDDAKDETLDWLPVPSKEVVNV